MEELNFFGNDGCPLYAVSLSWSSKDLKPTLVLLHGGGPDHQSLIPLAHQLSDKCKVVLPDLRGYGRSVCVNAARFTWQQYTDDLIALLDHLGINCAFVGGAGIGTTISLKAAIRVQERIEGLILISIEDIENDDAKKEEIKLLETFAASVRSYGTAAAWEPILSRLSPVIGDMVRDAIPRSDPASIAAAAAIVHDCSFTDLDELASIITPTLIVPGDDFRHPAALAQQLAKVMGNAQLAKVSLSTKIRTAQEFADELAPAINDFLNSINRNL